LISIRNYNELYTIEPNKRSGKPYIHGLRATVYNRLKYLASSMIVNEMLIDFIKLKQEDKHTAFTVDHEHKLFINELN